MFKPGYDHDEADKIVSYIDATGTIEGAPDIKDEHLAVFDCSFKPAKGTRSIHYMGHLKMMAAAQPFISGAISKTVNLPENASVEDIMECYLQAWKLGLKAVAVYRDGCKKSQPLSASGTTTALRKKGDAAAASPPSTSKKIISTLRRAPSATSCRKSARRSLTNSTWAATRATSPSAFIPTANPGELFITMAKEGSTVSGLMDSFALAVSIALQHGVPLKLFCEKFAHTRFEPSGWTGNPDIGFAKSIMDYIFRWLQLRFLTGQQGMLFENLRLRTPGAGPSQPSGEASGSAASDQRSEVRGPTPGSVHAADALAGLIDLGDAPTCSFCGSIMTRNGSCYRCGSCGSTSGCS